MVHHEKGDHGNHVGTVPVVDLVSRNEVTCPLVSDRVLREAFHLKGLFCPPIVVRWWLPLRSFPWSG